MGKYEVTQGEYSAAMGSNPSYFQGGNLPVETVSWHEAVAYCAGLTERERSAGRLPAGWAYRLPTEAEYEYACRAGSTNRFSYGDDPGYTQVGNYAWYLDNSSYTTHAVGGKLPNRWGLYDMRGNVSEWVQDWDGPYPADRQIDPLGPSSGTYRIVRGGSWSPILLEPDNFRCAHRGGGYELDRRNIYFGFRCARSL
jgi:formylglycine-generating enzyme required for sulfatase activity